jgi:hypothetical protein
MCSGWRRGESPTPGKEDPALKLLPHLQDHHFSLADILRAPGFHHSIIEVRRIDHQVVLDHLNDERVGFWPDLFVIHKEILFLGSEACKTKTEDDPDSLKTRKIRKSRARENAEYVYLLDSC